MPHRNLRRAIESTKPQENPVAKLYHVTLYFSIKTSTAEGRKSQLVHRLPSNYVLNPYSAIDQSYPYFQR